MRRGERNRLTPAEILRLTLERQGLLRRASGLDPPAAVERFGPLHATDHHTPYLSLLARLEDFAIGDLDREWLVQRRFDRRATMRTTFHLVPAARLGDMVCAFGLSDPADHAFLRGAGISRAEIERLGAAVEASIASHGPLELSGLKRVLPSSERDRANEKTPTGLSVLVAVVRGLTDAGRLALVARVDPGSGMPRSGWSRSPQAYERFTAVFGALPTCLGADADVGIARWYFEAHGPAAVEDWLWWTGLPGGRARAAFETVRPELAEAAVDGWPELVYLPRRALDGRPTTAEDGPTVRLLPYEDAGIKAYRATRRRFFEPAAAERQQTRYGEVLPAVLVDGRVVGTWSSGAGGWAGAQAAAAGRPERGLWVELFAPVERGVDERLEAELERVRAAIEVIPHPARRYGRVSSSGYVRDSGPDERVRAAPG